jgi:hypothetical protein
MTQSIPTERRRARTATDDERSPDNVAPAVAYLASERSDWCNGQVLLAVGYQIGLFNVPELVREVVLPGPWNVEQATHLLEARFKPAVRVNQTPAVGIGVD